MSIRRPVVTRAGWADCRRSLRVISRAQRLARQPYEAVVVEVEHGSRSARILVPTSDCLKSILQRAIDDTDLAVHAADHGICLPTIIGRVPISPVFQKQIMLRVLINMAITHPDCPERDPRFMTTARFADELTFSPDAIRCVLELLPGETD